MAAFEVGAGGGSDLDEEEPVVQLTEEEKAEHLIAACKAGDVARVHELFEDGATVAARDSRGWSPLVWASFYGHDDVVAALLQHQADVDYRKAKDDAEAAARKQAATEALSSAAAGSMRRKKGDGGAAVSVPVNSPLHWAAFKGRVNVVWQLLLHGFSAQEVDENGNNALHLAAAGGHADVVRSLMCQGFEVDCPNGFGNDALCLSTEPGVVSLLASAVAQAQCPICHKYFGGEVKRYLCDCTGQFFTEDCSEAQHIFASVEEDIRKPVRYSSRALETIQEAEAALHEAMHPNRRGEGEEGADGEEGGSGDGGDGGVLTEESKGDLAAEADGDAAVELTRADLPRLEEALDGVKRVGGDIRLIAAGTALRARLKAQMRLEDEVAALDKRRPLTRRTDVSELVAATRAAEEVGVDAKLVEQASTLAELALAECKLRGMITVCGNIALATHDHDGDMARLQEAFGICSRLGAGAELVAEGDALFKKLRTEVALFDVVNEVQGAWDNVQKVVEECRIFAESPDFSLLPRPEPVPGPDGEMVPPPTKQMVALDALRDKLAELDELATNAPDTGASEQLTTDAREAHTRLSNEWREAVAAEEERAAVEEAARVKLEKKLKKKNKKKGKKKK